MVVAGISAEAREAGKIPGSGFKKRMSGDLVRWTERAVDDMPGRNSGGYDQPTSDEQSRFRRAVQALFEGNPDEAHVRASRVGYRVVEFHDAGATSAPELLALFPAEDRGGGRGYYFVRPGFLRRLVVESPHPKFDMNSGVLASRIFRDLGARAFALAGTHRCASSRATPCSGLTRACGGWFRSSYPVSDMAHTVDSFFQVFHEVADTDLAGTGNIVSVHGFSSGSDDPEFTLSDGTEIRNPDPLHFSNAVAEVLEQAVAGAGGSKPGNSCNRPGDDYVMCGSTNVQARYTNGLSTRAACRNDSESANGRFLHMELSYDLRNPGGGLEPGLVIDSLRQAIPE